MAQPNFTEMMKNFSNFSMPTMDFNAMIATGRRNMEALSTATQMMAESAQTIARRQMETARASMEQAMHTSREMMTGANPEQNISKQTAFVQSAMESAMENLREVSDMAAKSSFEAAKIVQESLSNAMSEMQKASSKK